jgi:hypothetical protein
MNKKQKLEELYKKLTDGQRFAFNFLYGSLDTITDDKIDKAITTCEKYTSIKPNVITTLPGINLGIFHQKAIYFTINQNIVKFHLKVLLILFITTQFVLKMVLLINLMKSLLNQSL